MNAFCPSCEKQLSSDAARCKLCGADFSDPEGWKPTAEPGKGQRIGAGQVIRGVGLIVYVAGRLAVGGATWLGCLLIAIFAGISSSPSSGESLLGLVKVLAVPIVIWALMPIIKLFMKK